MKIGVLISGRGSNLEALLAAKARGELHHAEFGVVISNILDARGLDVARRHGVPTVVVDHRGYRGDRTGHEHAIIEAAAKHGCEALVLAGYMRIIGRELLHVFPNRMINIHPSLLPSFPGLHAQRQAIEHGVKWSGCTVHFVDEGMDSGPIIVQRIVEVRQEDTEETLAARILEQEHKAIVEAVDLFTQGRLTVEGRRVVIGESVLTHRQH